MDLLYEAPSSTSIAQVQRHRKDIDERAHDLVGPIEGQLSPRGQDSEADIVRAGKGAQHQRPGRTEDGGWSHIMRLAVCINQVHILNLQDMVFIGVFFLATVVCECREETRVHVLQAIPPEAAGCLIILPLEIGEISRIGSCI